MDSTNVTVWVNASVYSACNNGTQLYNYYNNADVTSTSNVNNTLGSGIISFYTMTGNANDYVSNINGTITGATLTTDRNGNSNNAYAFSGTAQYISMGNEVAFKTTKTTISAWIYNTDVVGEETIFNNFHFAAGYYGYTLKVNGDEIRFLHGTSGTNGVVDTTDANMSINTWYFVTATYNGTDVIITVNGVTKTLNYGTHATGDMVYTGTFDSGIGKNEAEGELFSGKIDDVRVYNTNIDLSNQYTASEPTYSIGAEQANSTTTYTINVKDQYDNSAISNFSIYLNGTEYSTTNGTLTLELNDTYDVNITSGTYYIDNICPGQDSGYWPKSLTNQTFELGQTYTYYLYQAVLYLNATEKITNQILNGTFYVPLQSNNSVLYLKAGSYNITFETPNYHNVTGTKIVDEYKINASCYQTFSEWGIPILHCVYEGPTIYYTTIENVYTNILNITATDKNNNTISNFTITLEYIGNYTYSENQTTTDGENLIGIINGTYNITINAPGYEIKEETIISTGDLSHIFSLYTTNSISFTFKDEESKNIVNDRNITIELISDAFSSNYSTSNGTLYVDILSPTEYTIRYAASGYSERFYYFNLLNRTHTDLTLYLVNATTTTSVTAIVYDQNNNLVENVYLKVLRYDLTSNSYLIQEIVKTNFEGIGILHLILNDEFYKFILEYNDEVVKETAPAYIYTTSLTFQFVIGETVATDFFNTNDVSYTLVFNDDTNNFRYTYTDSNNIVSQGCLIVWRVTYSANTLISTTCSTGATGTILAPVSNISGADYKASAYIYFDDDKIYLMSYWKSFLEDNVTGNFGLFLIIILMVIFAFIGSWNPIIAVLMFPLPLFFGELIGIINIGMMYIIGIEMLAITIAYMISTKS